MSARFRLPKARRPVVDVLTDDEVRRLLSCFSPRSTLQLRDLCLCSLMLDSGLRRHEAAFLSLDGLHLAEGYAVVTGKGNKQRFVPLGLYTRQFSLQQILGHTSLEMVKRYVHLIPGKKVSTFTAYSLLDNLRR